LNKRLELRIHGTPKICTAVVITSQLLFTVIDMLAEVKLQDLLDHAILCIVQVHEIILTSVAGKNIQKIVPVFKLVFALGIVSTNKDSPANTVTVICF
jgi:hypothetical protein